MDASIVLGAIAGFAQPWIQEFLIRNNINGEKAHAVTIGIALVLASAVLWLTGTFAGLVIPAFSLADPSPLFWFVVERWLVVYGLAAITFGFATKPIHAIAGTAPTTDATIPSVP